MHLQSFSLLDVQLCTYFLHRHETNDIKHQNSVGWNDTAALFGDTANIQLPLWSLLKGYQQRHFLPWRDLNRIDDLPRLEWELTQFGDGATVWTLNHLIFRAKQQSKHVGIH